MALAPGTALFSTVGSPAGDQLATWCPAAGRVLRRNLMRERARLDEDPIRIVIDVGSFDGTDAISFATASQQRVWTFEPTPSKHDGIRRRLNEAGVAGNVTLFPFALSNKTGDGQLEVLRAAKPKGRKFMNNQLGSAQDLLTQDVRPGQLPTTRAGVVKVPIRQLDQVVADHAPPLARVAFMKVDAQGFDTLVLRGASRLLSERRIEKFVFEFTPFLMPGRENEAVAGLMWLERLGHLCVPCNQAHTTAVKLRAPASIVDYVEYFRGKNDKYDDIACRPAGGTRRVRRR